MKTKVVNEAGGGRSLRVEQVVGMFDLDVQKARRVEVSAELPAAAGDWRIGLIVGPSGSGKSSVARAAVKAGGAWDGLADLYEPGVRWPAGAAMVDGMPAGVGMKEIAGMLTAVGLSSPPAWVRPYEVLSGGEKFRADLARAVLSAEPGSVVVFDEFTSVVDRTVAKVGSAAVAKAVRRMNGPKLVAVTCHYDVAEWLQPDWVVDMGAGGKCVFAGADPARGSLRRPEIFGRLYRCRPGTGVGRRLWQTFGKHHYLDSSLHPAAQCYVGVVEKMGDVVVDEPVCLVAVLSMTGRAGRDRISRVVVLPDWQGIGVGGAVLRAVAADRVGMGRRVSLVTRHPGMLAGLKRAGSGWKCVGALRNGHRAGRSKKVDGRIIGSEALSRGRPVVSFEYVGGGPR
jgi:ABC-type polar amino acid transport system ATPase subunit